MAAHSRTDLRDYFSATDINEVHQPAWLNTQALCIPALMEAREDEAWVKALTAQRTYLDNSIITGTVSAGTATALAGIPDILEAARQAEGLAGGMNALGFLVQITLSDAEWQNFLKAFAADRKTLDESEDGDGDARPTRLANFLDAIMTYHLRRGQHAVPRAIYFQIYKRIDALARDAMRQPRDFDAWHAALVLLATHLTLRRQLPKRVDCEPEEASTSHALPDEHSGGSFDPGPQKDHPLLALLFSPEESKTIHRKEAYAAECFAHLFTAVHNGEVSEDTQALVAADFAERMVADRFAARQWHARKRAMFEAAPYTAN